MVQNPGAEIMSQKLKKLEDLLKQLESVVVCFSGGLDSSFLLKVANDVLGERAVGLTAIGPAFPESERNEAQRIADEVGARLITAASREFDNPDYVRNPKDRCYYCKTELYTLAEEHKRKLGFAFVVDGSTVDDMGDYRPGLTAARDTGARSPLLEVGLTKAEVREIARQMGLSFWDKPAAACLASRIPYGTSITSERLSRIERFEKALHRIGLKQVRVRFHHEVARIEVAKDEIDMAFAKREELLREGLAAGFLFVALDLAGYRTGSLNRLLTEADVGGHASGIDRTDLGRSGRRDT
jgi:uncharacterized protein